MALVFHDGFETGGAEAWTSTLGTPSFHADYAHSGNYGMQCNASGSIVYVRYEAASGSTTQGYSFYFYLTAAPSAECTIFSLISDDAFVFKLTIGTDRKLNIYDDQNNKEGTTASALNTGQWYHLELKYSAGDFYCQVDGSDEIIATGTSRSIIEYRLGVQSTVTANFYYDDFVITDSADYPGDIRVLAARPVAEGTDQDTGTGADWQDSDNTPAVYTELDQDPPNTTDYNWAEADGGAMYYSVGLDDCGSGNLADIGAGDTIEAVSFMYYYATDGGGSVDEYNIYGRDAGGRSSLTALDDPKDPTWVSEYETQSWVTTPAAWTQTNFNNQQMGMMCQDAN